MHSFTKLLVNVLLRIAIACKEKDPDMLFLRASWLAPREIGKPTFR